MDLDFSQIGQNVARSAQAQDLTQAVTPEQAGQQTLREVSQVAKASGDEADTKESLGNSSVDVQSAVAEISEFVQAQNRQLSFSVDEGSQRPVVKVTDADSGEVIRQIPSEEVLALSERIKELQTDVGAAVGVLFNKEV